MIELRCKRTGISHLTFSDLPVAFQDGNPSPIPGYDARMARRPHHVPRAEPRDRRIH